jgi:hypothetical protein
VPWCASSLAEPGVAPFRRGCQAHLATRAVALGAVPAAVFDQHVSVDGVVTLDNRTTGSVGSGD